MRSLACMQMDYTKCPLCVPSNLVIRLMKGHQVELIRKLKLHSWFNEFELQERTFQMSGQFEFHPVGSDPKLYHTASAAWTDCSI